MPPWLVTLIQFIEQLLAGLLAQQTAKKQAAVKRGCDPGSDAECLSLDAAIKSAEATKAALATHAALCCCQPE